MKIDANEERKRYLLIEMDEDCCPLFVVGVYPTMEDAKKEAAAYIKSTVENMDIGSGERTYEELCALGAGIKEDWYKTELEGGQSICYNADPDGGRYILMVIPIPNGYTKPISKFQSTDLIRIRDKSAAITNGLNNTRFDISDEEAEGVLDKVKEEASALIRSIEQIQDKLAQ